jgi:hypothetical protein
MAEQLANYLEADRNIMNGVDVPYWTAVKEHAISVLFFG